MKFSYQFVFLLTLLCPAMSYAQSATDRIETALKSCVEKSEGVTANTRNCYSTAYPKMDKRLNEVYRELMSKLPPEKQAFLKEAQKKWLAYRKAEEKLSWMLDQNYGGTVQLLTADDFAYELLKARVIQIEKYLPDMNQDK